MMGRRILWLAFAALTWQCACGSRTSVIVDEVIAGLKALGMTWTEEQEFGIVERLQMLVRLRHNYPYPRDDRGRGILMVGNGVQLKNSYISLRILRENLKCNLPVEIAYNGQDEAPKPELKRLFEEMPDVRLLDSSSVKLASAVFSGLRAEREDEARRHGFSQKIFAITFVTTFTEVLFLDTDNLPLINPEVLFSSSGYQQSGSMFWPDWWTREGIVPMKPGLYHILHVPVPWEETSDGSYRGAESGQILLDRHRHRDVMQWLWWLAVNHNITDRYLHGDKDLFRIAFVLAGKGPEYDQIPIPARQAVGIRPTNNGSVLEHLGMVQLTPSGGLAFHHRTAKCKYFPHCHGRQETCRVVYLTASLSHDEAVKSNGNEGIWKPEHVDVTAWDSLGCRSPKAGEPDDMPEMLCSRQTEPDQRLVPLFEVDSFGKSGQILQAAHELVLRLERDFPYVF